MERFDSTSPFPEPQLLVVTYQVAIPTGALTAEKLHRMATQIAIGQTIGTAKQAEIEALRPYMAEVLSTEILTQEESGDALGHIRIGFPLRTVDCDLGTLLCVIFGKLSMAGKIRVVDIDIPAALIDRFHGPRFGISGIRKQVGVESGPLLMSIFKPCLGLSEQTLAEMFYTQAISGVNLVKDDEILSDSDFDAARRRLAACLSAAERAKRETGRNVLYAINLTGPAEQLLSRARTLVSDGATALLFNYLCYGLPMLSALRSDPEITVPLVGHPSLAGAVYGSPVHGLSPQVIFGRLPRLAGADLMLFPSPYGSVALPLQDALAVKTALTEAVHHLKPTFPVPSAGITAEMASRMVADFGADVVINAGTGIHDHPEGPLKGVQAFVSAMHAAYPKAQPIASPGL